MQRSRPGAEPRIQYWGTNEDVSSTGWWAFQTDAGRARDGVGPPRRHASGSEWKGRDFVTMYYDDALRYQRRRPVGPGQRADETLSFCLVRGRTISGRVFYDRDGDGVQTRNANPDFDEPGLANVCLNARPASKARSATATCTDANGDYAITGVLPVYPYPGGTPVQYRVWANAQGTPYASEYFDRDPDGSRAGRRHSSSGAWPRSSRSTRATGPASTSRSASAAASRGRSPTSRRVRSSRGSGST